MNPKRIELFERYCLDDLSKSEQLAFKEELKSDPVFKQEYEAFLQVKDSLIHAKNIALKKKINTAIERSDSKMAREKTWKILYAAASVFIICSLLLYLNWNTSKTNSLYSEFYKPYSETTTVLSNEKDSFVHCLNEYNKELYRQALDCFKIRSSSSDQFFYMGMCYANLDFTDSAIVVLTHVEKLNSSFLQETNWYLALFYLKQNNLEDAKERLHKVLNTPNSSYQKNSAKKLLLELEE